jgi:hypothetical protein
MSKSFEKFGGEQEKDPEVPMASKPKNPVFKEVHERGFVGRTAEEKVEETREIILQRFKIPFENALTEAVGEGEVRKIRAFMILKNRETSESWYGEGHKAHVVLLGQLIEEFGGKYGLSGLADILDEEGLKLSHPWETLKGFIDPYQDGFKSFPKSREALVEQLRENEVLNDMEDEDVEAIENGEKPIPNWFLTGHDSS